MLRDALSVLPRSDDGIGTAIVGGVLLLVTIAFLSLWVAFVVATPVALLAAPVALAPALILRGYHVRVVQSGLHGETGVPSFVGWGRLYRTGVASLLLSMALLLPAAVLVLLGGAAAAVIQLGRVDLGGMAEPVYAVSIAFLALLLVGYLFAFLYLRPAALASFAATGRLTAGLSPRRVVRVAGSGGFATGWLVAMFLTLAGLTLVGPLVVILVGFPLVFVVRVVAHNLYGRGAAEVLDRGEPAAVPEPGPKPDVATLPPGDDAERAEPESSVAVQVGRRVPLTATDVLSRAAVRESVTAGSDDREAAEADQEATKANDEAAFEWADADEE